MIIRSMTAAVLGLAIVAAAATPVAEFPRSDAKTPLAKTETLSVPNLNPREGTLCFKFCPEWAPYSYRPSKIIELRFAPDFAISFHKGISQPNYCYLNVGGPLNTASSFPSDNLFTAGQWRSYAVRWSKARDRAEVVVDGFVAGSGPGSTGRYACELPGVVTGALRLEGDSRGAFKDVKVFDRYLEGQEFLGACGLKEAQQYLQWQRPPPGGTQSYGDVGGYSYVDPATGRTIAVAGSSGGATVPYNPARMPDLPSAPHTPWAKPLPGGPLKALFVLPTGFYSSNSMVGEVAELWRRLDMDCEATDTLTDEIANKRYDVIAVSHQGYGGRKFRAWDDLDENLRRWVIDQVKGGKSGLLHAYTDPYPQLPRPLRGEIAALYAPKARAAVAPVLRGFPGEAMHRINFFGNNRYDKVYELEDGWFLDTDDFAKNIVEVFDHGNAVAVKLNYVCSHWEGANTMAFVPNTALNAAATDVDYDHWQALAVRALLVAARRAPEATIAELEIKDGACAARLQGLRQPAKLWCRIQDRWGKVFAERTIPVAGDGKVELPLPASTPPRAFVDLVLRDGQGAALDFFSAATPPAQGSRVVGVSLDKDYYQRGDTVLAAVEIAGGREGAGELSVSLIDWQGRRIARQATPVTLRPGRQRLGASLAIPGSDSSLLLRLEAALLQDGRVVDASGADLPVPEESFDGFYTGVYGGAMNTFRDRQTRARLRDEFGLDYSCTTSKCPNINCAKENLLTLQQVSHFSGYHSPKAFEEWMKPWEDFYPGNLGSDPGQVKRFRPLMYSLGEEHRLITYDDKQPEANRKFRRHLQGKYPSLDALNQVWDTKFKSWDDVTMMPKELIDVLKLEDGGPPRFESRRFLEHLFADKHAFLADYWRRLDSRAEVGIHVGWDLWMGRGYDYWLLSRSLDGMCGYPGPQNQYIRSFFQKPLGCWYHYCAGSVEDVRWTPWQMLISGMRGFGWYTLGPQRWWAATTADMRLASDFAASKDEFRDAGDLGDVLSQARFQDNQVAVHYSQDSMHTLGFGPGNLSWVHWSFINLFYDHGVPFKFVSYEEVAKGELARRRYRVFLMPSSVSLSPEEAKAIRDYAAQGRRGLGRPDAGHSRPVWTASGHSRAGGTVRQRLPERPSWRGSATTHTTATWIGLTPPGRSWRRSYGSAAWSRSRIRAAPTGGKPPASGSPAGSAGISATWPWPRTGSRPTAPWNRCPSLSRGQPMSTRCGRANTLDTPTRSTRSWPPALAASTPCCPIRRGGSTPGWPPPRNAAKT